MPDRLGPRVPADALRAARNRLAVRRLVLRSDPVLATAAGREVAARDRERRRSRSRRSS